MFKKINEVVSEYRKELVEYVTKLEKLKKDYGTENCLTWSKEDWDWVNKMSVCFEKIEKILGFTAIEIKRELVLASKKVKK